MTEVAEKFGKTSGVKLRHFIIAFEENEKINAMKAYQIDMRIVGYFIHEHQTVFAVHKDTKHPHIGVVEIVERSEGKKTKKQCEIDFVVNVGSKKYYIQSALNVSEPSKMETELRSLKNTNPH